MTLYADNIFDYSILFVCHGCAIKLIHIELILGNIWYTLHHCSALSLHRYLKSFLVEDKDLLIHWGRVTHICVSELTIIGSDNGLSPGRAPSHYQNQCWNIVNKTPRNKLQWKFNQNSNISIQENAFESVVCEKAAILSRPQCVNPNRVNTMAADGLVVHGIRAQGNRYCPSSQWIF